jgi:hypothetical protein
MGEESTGAPVGMFLTGAAEQIGQVGRDLMGEAPMSYTIRGEWVTAAFAGKPVTSAGATHALSVHQIGSLELPSGRLAASDPFVDPAPAPFRFQVTPGTYAVDLAVSDRGTGDQRVAFARIVFRPGPVHRWTMAVVGDQDPAELGADGIFGYGVDSGSGCFMSPEAGALLARRLDAETDYYDKLIAEMEKTYRNTWDWVLFEPEAGRGVNVAAFSSGYGDGVYASYCGSGEGGEILCVVTDFGVIADEPVDLPSLPAKPKATRPWWKFWV